MTEKELRCRHHYQSVYERNLLQLSKGRALDESLHHFLDQRPTGKNLAARDRATGLASATFWLDVDAVTQSKLASLALARVLHFDDAINVEVLVSLSGTAPDMLRWAIRYSKLFERAESPLWLALCSELEQEEWQVFFGVCERLLDQLKPFDEVINSAEKEIEHLSLLELFSYIGVLGYHDLDEDVSGKKWEVYNRIILRKLRTCSEEDFRLNESRVMRSLKDHLTPIIFPEPSIVDVTRCDENLAWLVILMTATQERIDYEGQSNSFLLSGAVALTPLPRERTRLHLTLEFRPRNLGARLLLQSARLGRARLESRLGDRLAELAALLEAGARA